MSEENPKLEQEPTPSLGQEESQNEQSLSEPALEGESKIEEKGTDPQTEETLPEIEPSTVEKTDEAPPEPTVDEPKKDELDPKPSETEPQSLGSESTPIESDSKELGSVDKPMEAEESMDLGKCRQFLLRQIVNLKPVFSLGEAMETSDLDNSNVETKLEQVEKMDEETETKIESECKDEKVDLETEPEDQKEVKNEPTFVTQIVDKDLSSLDEEDVANDNKEDIKDEIKPEMKNGTSVTDFKALDTIFQGYACGQCQNDTLASPKALVWEMKVFCDDTCLKKFQSCFKICNHCDGSIDFAATGKYSFRCDSAELKQFCTVKCLEQWKAINEIEKDCLFCQGPVQLKESGGPGVVVGVGHDKSLPRPFCSSDCLDQYNLTVGKKKMESWSVGPVRKACHSCAEDQVVYTKLINDDASLLEFCSDSCLTTYKFSKDLTTLHCACCSKHFITSADKSYHGGFNGGTRQAQHFCSWKCLHFYRLEKTLPNQCAWCNYAKMDVSMISGIKGVKFCSTNCLYMHRLSNNDSITETQPKQPIKPKVQVRNKGM